MKYFSFCEASQTPSLYLLQFLFLLARIRELKRERIYLGYSFRLQSTLAVELQLQYLGVPSNIALVLKTHGWCWEGCKLCWYAAAVLHFTQFRIPCQGVGLPSVKLDCPTSINPNIPLFRHIRWPFSRGVYTLSSRELTIIITISSGIMSVHMLLYWKWRNSVDIFALLMATHIVIYSIMSFLLAAPTRRINVVFLGT